MAENLRIAVPKGSLFADAVELLTKAGLDTTGLADPGRKLIISNPGVDFIIVRPTDAPVFCAYGGADCGMCGKDTLVEAELNVMEMVDLKFGGCRFIVAEPEEAAGRAEQVYERTGSLRVATKYPAITQRFFAAQGKPEKLFAAKWLFATENSEMQRDEMRRFTAMNKGDFAEFMEEKYGI